MIAIRLAEAPGPRVLGLRVKERNRRLIERKGARLAGADESEPVLLVPETEVLLPSLFDAVPALTADVDPPSFWPAGAQEETVMQLAPEHVLDVSTGAKKRRAEHRILRATEKPTDGWVSRNFNRPQSRFFSLWFLRAGMTANMASGVCFAIGTLTGWMAAQPGWFALAATGVLFQIASMFDGVDGEMARATLSQSKMGAAIDTIVDNYTYLATLVGFGIGWYREGITPIEIYTLGAIALMLVVTMLLVLAFVRRHAPDASFVFFDRSVRHAIATKDTAPLRMVGRLFYATRRDVLSVIVMALGFTGMRMAIVLLLLAGTLLVQYVLWFHGAALRESALALNPPGIVPETSSRAPSV